MEWVFAYGSLIWNPEFDFDERHKVRIEGYHRAFCINSHTYRGTPDAPGVVLGLDCGGSCEGIVYRVRRGQEADIMDRIYQREMVSEVYRPLVVDIPLPDGRQVQALTFIACQEDLHGYLPGPRSEVLRRLREYGLRRAVIRIAQKLGIAGAPHASNESSALPLPAPEETVRQAPSPARFAHDLEVLLKRGVNIRLVYANTLMGRYDLRHHHHHIFSRLGQPAHFAVEMVPHTDHVFTRIEARRHLIRGMAAWLQHFQAQPPAPEAEPGAA